jgi:hypothetical protein
MKIAKLVRQIVTSNVDARIEVKCKRLTGTITDGYTTNMKVQLLSSISQGDTTDARSGNRVTLKRLQFRGLQKNGDGTIHHVRLAIVRWRPMSTPIADDFRNVDNDTLNSWNRQQ